MHQSKGKFASSKLRTGQIIMWQFQNSLFFIIGAWLLNILQLDKALAIPIARAVRKFAINANRIKKIYILFIRALYNYNQPIQMQIIAIKVIAIAFMVQVIGLLNKLNSHQIRNPTCLTSVIRICLYSRLDCNSNLNLFVFDDQFIKNAGSDLFLRKPQQHFLFATSVVSNNLGSVFGQQNNIQTELLQVLLILNQAASFGQDFVGTLQALSISLNAGKTLLQTIYIYKTKTLRLFKKQFLRIIKYYFQQFITQLSAQIMSNYFFYYEKLRSFITYNLILRLIAFNSFNQQNMDITC
ncbi:hypothetical protein pb186bvf_019046 [Paramecium bursaria]